LRRQIANIEENLLLIEERRSEYIIGTDVPMQLVKEERQAREKLVELQAKLANI
jgi:hypothetical protein